MIERVELGSSFDERQRWNTFVAHMPNGHLMQSWEWGKFKQATGWRVKRIGIMQNNMLAAGAQILFKPLPLLPYTIAYIPKGPLIDCTTQSLSDTFWQAVHQTAQQQHALFLKVEPHWLDNSSARHYLKQNGFVSTIQTNQPRCTWLVDLDIGEEALWAGMRKKTRKLVRNAIQTDVDVIQGSGADLDEFYRILKVTAGIKNIPVQKAAFFHQVWQTFQDTDVAHLFLARHHQEIIAAKMVFAFGQTSMHLWGGTTDYGRQVNASYLIQWEAIRWAISVGLTCADLWGIPDEIADLLHDGQPIPQDRQDGLWGVYAFKRGFGGRTACYVGAFDYPYHPLIYRIMNMVLGQRRVLDKVSTLLDQFSWNHYGRKGNL